MFVGRYKQGMGGWRWKKWGVGDGRNGRLDMEEIGGRKMEEMGLVMEEKGCWKMEEIRVGD